MLQTTIHQIQNAIGFSDKGEDISIFELIFAENCNDALEYPNFIHSQSKFFVRSFQNLNNKIQKIVLNL
jgi:hypothetical protein